MKSNVALGANSLLQATGFIETVNRSNHRLTLVIEQQSTVHQPYRTRTALALAPALSRADHLAPVKVDVETSITERTLYFAQRRNAAQLIE